MLQLVEKDKENLKKKEEVKTIKIGRSTKVLVLNSSPKKENGNTALILNPFVEGMRDKGADVEIINLYDLRIVPCTGELHCWKVTPGECAQKDDMQLLYPKIKKADAIIIAAPIYVETINAKMKNVIDRMTPLVEPFMIGATDNNTFHELRDGVSRAKVVLISTCSHWDTFCFDEIVDYIEKFCSYFSYKFVGCLLRPHAEIIQYLLKNGRDLDSMFEAARTAGEEFIENYTISEDLADIISEELMPKKEYIKIINEQFEEELAKHK